LMYRMIWFLNTFESATYSGIPESVTETLGNCLRLLSPMNSEKFDMSHDMVASNE